MAADGVTLVLMVLAFGILAALYRAYVNQAASDALLLAFTFVPALLFWVADKPLLQLEGFGFSAQFSEKLTTPAASLQEDLEDLRIPLEMTGTPDDRAAMWEACYDFFVMRPSEIPPLGADGASGASRNAYIVSTTRALRASLACGRLRGVLILDDQNRYLGSFDAGFYREALSLWAIARDGGLPDDDEMARLVLGSTIFGASLIFPERRIEAGEGFIAAINERATLRDVFDAFTRTDWTFIVLTDDLGRFTGVLPRDRVDRSLLDAVMRAVGPGKDG